MSVSELLCTFMPKTPVRVRIVNGDTFVGVTGQRNTAKIMEQLKAHGCEEAFVCRLQVYSAIVVYCLCGVKRDVKCAVVGKYVGA